MGGGRRMEILMTFKETLKKACAEVDSWPQWMRESLGRIRLLEK